MIRGTDSIHFGTDGWRGIIADDFTFANVCRVTRAIAQYLEATYGKDRPVLVGYDTRFLADQFAQTAAGVLAEAGWQVKLVDRDCPTPAIAYNARLLNTAGALMFTASHNPAPYCGIKYIPDYGGPATRAITDQIEAAIPHADHRLPGHSSTPIPTFDPKPAYLNFIYTLLDGERIRNAHLRVNYDALYSTSRGYLDTALQHLGCQVDSLHTHRDVLFGGGIPEPKGRQMDELVARVQRNGADLGLATDGDSDRFGIVDDRGTLLDPNMILLLLIRHLVRNRGKTGAIVRTVATTHLLDTLAAKYGLPIYETPVGFKYVGKKMRETQALIGGEESGGLSILGHIPEKDGILANLLVVEAIAWEGKPLSQLIQDGLDEVGGPVYNTRLDLRLTHAQKIAVTDFFVQNTLTAIAEIPVKEVGQKDGVKLYLEDGSWVLFRASGTEPLMRVYVEAQSPEKKEIIAEYLRRAIAETISQT